MSDANSWRSSKASPIEAFGTSLVLIGVGHHVRDVVRDSDVERYGQRNLKAFKVPLLTDAEAQQIIDQRAEFGVTVAPQAAQTIVRVACGYPFLVHRLAYDAGS